jgi:DNA-binding beta-propeller fold protein YncE
MRFWNPVGIAISGTAVLVADRSLRIVEGVGLSAPTGSSSLLGPQFGSDDGSAALAKFNMPQYVAVHPVTNDIFVSDTANNFIRQIDVATFAVVKFAGKERYTHGATASADGHRLTAAQLAWPMGIAFDKYNHLIFVDDW